MASYELVHEGVVHWAGEFDDVSAAVRWAHWFAHERELATWTLRVRARAGGQADGLAEDSEWREVASG